MQELVVALGGALFVANVLALARRKSDQKSVPTRTKNNTKAADYVAAPVARSVTYALIGLVVMIWGIASVLN